MIHTQCPACHRRVALSLSGDADHTLTVVCPSCVDAMRAEARTAKESEAAAVQRLGELALKVEHPVRIYSHTTSLPQATLEAEIRRLRNYIAEQSHQLMRAEDDVRAMRDLCERRAVELAVANERAAAMEREVNTWIEKTEWVQEEFNAGNLPATGWGKHRADIIRGEVERLRKQLEAVRAAVNP